MMQVVIAMTIVCLLAASPELRAQVWMQMYDLSTLEQVRPRYERSTRKILEWITPVLYMEEKQRLGVGARIDFPLYSGQSKFPTPLDFYAPLDPPHVVMPIFSLKFLDDLCTAYAWLQINGYSLETVSEYTAWLQERRTKGGRISPPLKALQIPANARSDPRVDEWALNHFTTARTFILLHELGHLYRRHSESTIANEQEADQFAVKVMGRTVLKPIGMLVFFLADAHWSYPSAEATHPLSGARVKALADHIDDPGLAHELRKLGVLIDDPEIRAGFAASGKGANEMTLAPRRPDERPMLGRERLGDEQGTLPAFHGKYIGESSQSIDSTRYPIEMVFQRQGNTVTGNYSFGIGVGRIEGTVSGDTLVFDWDWAGNAGRGAFKAGTDGETFSGTWGYRLSTDNAGIWTGRRVR
jgi:hypothetical protein